VLAPAPGLGPGQGLGPGLESDLPTPRPPPAWLNELVAAVAGVVEAAVAGVVEAAVAAAAAVAVAVVAVAVAEAEAVEAVEVVVAAVGVATAGAWMLPCPPQRPRLPLPQVPSQAWTLMSFRHGWEWLPTRRTTTLWACWCTLVGDTCFHAFPF
jgi:hypothetical protein